MSTTSVFYAVAAGSISADIVAAFVGHASLLEILEVYMIGAAVMSVVLVIFMPEKPSGTSGSHPENGKRSRRYKAPRICGIKLGRAREY